LRARSWDVAGAQKQFADAEAWRRKHDVDKLFVGFDSAELEKSRKYYPRWTGRRDKVRCAPLGLSFVDRPQAGMPVYVYHLASLDSAVQKELNSVSHERSYQRM
jgi:hypothetical protein